jgi:hypothetical protein
MPASGRLPYGFLRAHIKAKMPSRPQPATTALQMSVTNSSLQGLEPTIRTTVKQLTGNCLKMNQLAVVPKSRKKSN